MSDGTSVMSDNMRVMRDGKTVMSDDKEAFWEAVKQHINKAWRVVPRGVPGETFQEADQQS